MSGYHAAFADSTPTLVGHVSAVPAASGLGFHPQFQEGL